MHKRNAVRAALRGKRVAIAVAAAFVPLGEAYSLPTGENVVHGDVQVTRPTAQMMQINQGTQKGIVNWQGFSIGGSEHVNITQPSSSASLLNRVVGNDPSNIFGRLTANGQVFLVNNAGVFFAPGASVNAAAIVASTLSITDQNFLDNTYQFFNPGNAGSVVNQGSIVTAGGFTALIGPQVRNDGVIIANSGKIALGAGNRVSLDLIGDGLVSISVDEAAFNASVINTGTLQADGGTVFLKASSTNALLDTVINTSGVIRASGLGMQNGEIVLHGGDAGTVQVAGLVQAESGRIEISSGGALNVGSTVCCSPTTVIAATEEISAGSITVGGGAQIVGNTGTGSQTITTPGTLLVRGGILSGDVGLFHNGTGQQTVTAGNLELRGGTGTNTGAFINSNGGGDQTVTVSGALTVTGGATGTGNRAGLVSTGSQTINGNPDIVLTGGAGGGAGSLSNNVFIQALGGETKPQTVNARTIRINAGTGTDASATFNAARQVITTLGNVSLFGGGGLGGASNGARIGGIGGTTLGPTNLTLNVGGNLLLSGGTVNGVSLGSSGASTAANTIVVNAAGDIRLESLGGGARIGSSGQVPVTPGNVTVTAGGTFAMGNGTAIRANGPITLTANSLTNAGSITNGGGAANANMIFIADAFNLAGGTVTAGNAGVFLRPRTGTNSFGIEAAGATTLTNADIASINTANFLVFGSGTATNFTGNIVFGENAQVNGGTKNLAFIKSLSTGGTTTIGAHGLTTTGDVIVAAGAGSIVSNGGTVVGDEIQMRATQGIGTLGARVQTNANALTLGTSGSAFVSEANDVTLRNIVLNVGGNTALNTTTTSTGGALDLNVAGALNVTAAGTLDATVTSFGGQTITAQSLNITARDGRVAQILNNGAAGQSITAGSIDIQTAGGGGVAEIRNNAASSQNLTVTGERLTARGLGGGTAAVFSGGNQTISMAGAGPQQISLGDHAAQGRAFISAIGNQTIQGNADVILIGGSGPIADGSNAIISVLSPLSVQNIHARSITLANSMLGGNNSVAAIQGANQIITTTGDVTLTGNASGGNLAGVRIGGVGGAGATATNVTLNVGGDLVLTGGSVAGNGVGIGSTAALGAPPFENIVVINAQGSVILNSGVAGSGARIGSPQTGATPGSININAVGDIRLNGVAETAAIRTTGTVNLNAVSITEGPRGAVIAGTLFTSSAGATLLTGENQVSSFSATSGGALALNNSGALVTGGISASNVVLTNQGNVTVTAPVISASTMDVNVAGHLAVNGSGAVDALLRSSGGQTITAHSLSLTAQDGRRANIENVGGNQTVSATAGDMNLQVPGGFGVAQIVNTAAGGNQTIAVSGQLNVQGGVISPATSRNSGIFKNGAGGLQKVSAAGITLQGASTGTRAGALIASESDQLIDVTGGNINIFGGNGGNINNAAILASASGQQTIFAHDINLANGFGGIDTVAGIQAGHQDINATGNVTLTSQGALLGAAAGGPGVRIGAPQNTPAGSDITLRVGGNLTINGGSVAENGAAIGSSGAGTAAPNTITIEAGGNVILNAGTASGTGVRIGSGSNGTAGGSISIEAGGNIELNGTERSAAIRTLGNVTLEAASISQGTNGFILADTLTTTTSGVTNLAGPNEIARFNGTSGGALTLVDGGALQVTGITTTNDAITLTTDSLINIGTITNTGGAPGVANMTFNADAFNLAAGHIEAGAAAVVLRPRTGTNSFGIEAAGQTTLTNADIASINTNDFVVFGSGIGTTFTGNMTIGQDAQVNGGGKHLAFFRSPTAGGTITIGAQGVTTTGDVIVSAGGAAGSGAILSNGGTVAGDEVQLRAGQGIGTPGARVNTAANALGISNLGGAGVFVSEADAVTLRPISLIVGGMTNNAGSNTAGTFDFSAGGDLTVNGTVSSNGLMNINVAGALNVVGSGGLDAELLSGGGQNITAQSVSLSGRDNRRGNIRNTGGDQSVSATAGGMTLQGNGGAGVAQIINNAPGGNQTISVNGQLTVLGGATSTGSTNSGIFKNQSGGMQTVRASGITLQGASSGTNAGAVIVSRDEQLIDVTGGNINLIGGSGGIINNASISALQLTPTSPVRKQTILAHDISLTNSSGGTDTVAGIFGSDQTITATGNVRLTGGGALGAGPAVRIGAPGGTTTGTKLNMTVGGNLVLNGGTVAENAAAIGSSGQGVPQQNNIFIDAGGSVLLNAGTESGTGVRIGSGSGGTAGGNITIQAGGNIELNGTTERSAAIRTLDTVTLNAANISEVGLGTIIAGTLNTHSSGSTLLTGMDAAFNITNAVSNFNGVSGGDLRFFNRGPLTVTGLNAAGDASVVNALADLNLAGQWTSSTASIFTGAAIVESGAGAIQAASLTTDAPLGLSFAGANQVGVLDAKTFGVLTFNNVAPLEVARASASNGASLTSAGTMTISGPVISSSGISLAANGGSIVEAGAGSITTSFGSLTTFSSGDTTLNSFANQVSSFNATSGGNVSLVNNGFLNVTGLSAAGDAMITDFGNVSVGGAWTAGGTSAITAGDIILGSVLTSPTVVLNAGTGSITEVGAGAVIAGTLSTTSGGPTSLTGPNQVSNYNGTSGADLTLNNSGALTVTGLSAAGPAAVTNFGDVTLSGAWTSSSASITANGFGTISEAGGGFIQAGSLTTFSDGATNLTGANQVASFNGATSFGGTGGISLNNTVALNVTGLSTGGSATLTNAGDVNVTGAWSSSGATSVTTTGGDLTVTNFMSSGVTPGSGAMTLDVGGTLTVSANGPQGASVRSNAGQTIRAQSVEVVAQGGGVADITNSGGNQRITISGGGTGAGLDVHTRTSGGFAQIAHNTPGFTQTIEVTDADHINVNGASGAAMISNFGGTQTLSITGSGANAITLGAAGSLGPSQVFGGVQNVTAGTAGESGSITLVGGDGNATFTGFSSGQIIGGTQTVATSGTLRIRGGNAPNQPPSGFATGLFHNGSGEQRVSAANLEMQGGSSGVNNTAIIISSGGAGTIASGNQVIDVAGGNLELTGGSSGSNSTAIIVSFADQTVNAGSVNLRGGEGGANNGAFINIAGPGGGVGRTQTIDAGTIDIVSGANSFVAISAAKQIITTVGDLRITGNPGDGVVPSGARIGGAGGAVSGPTDLTLRVGGDLLLTSGGTNNSATIGASPPSAGGAPSPHVIDIQAQGDVILRASAKIGARIGTSLLAPSAGTGNISITAGRSIQLHGFDPILGPAGIRTASDVALVAGTTILETGSGMILANRLTTTSSGDTSLTGPNAVSSFNGTSSANLSLNNTGALDVTGVTAGGDATLNNVGNVTVSGPWTAGGTSTISVHSDIVLATVLTSTDVVLTADGSITEIFGAGAVVADTLTTVSGGSTSLPGQNRIANYSGTSGSDLFLSNRGALEVSSVSAVNANLTNDGTITISGPWTTTAQTTITASGPGASLVEAPGGFIQAAGHTDLFAQQSIGLNGPNQITGTLSAFGMQGNVSLTNTGDVSFAGTASFGNLDFTNVGSLNVTTLSAGGNSRLTNTGDVSFTGSSSFTFGSMDITTIGGDLTLMGSLSSGNAMTLDIGGTLTVSASGPQTAQILTNSGGQTITAQAVEVVAQNGGFATITNIAGGEQRITINGGGTGAGLDVHTMASGGFAQISQAAGFAQTIAVTDSDHINVNGVGGGASIFALGGPQTLSITGSGANAIRIGSPGARGFSVVSGAFNQNVTAGAEGQQGSITIVGADVSQTSASFGTNSSVGGTQTVSTAGTISITGGRSPGNTFAPGFFHNGTGQQTINAANIVLTGGPSGNNNAALIQVSGGGVPANGGAQVINVSGDITIAGGPGGNAGIIGSTTRQQSIHARNISLTNSESGGNNIAGIIQGGHQDIHATGNVTLTARGSGGEVTGVRIGGFSGAATTATNLTLDVGGDLVLNGGTAANNGASIGSTGVAGVPPLENNITINAGGSVILNSGTLAGTGARIGSPAAATGPGSINITAGGGIELNGVSQGTAIRTLGTVTLAADHIIEAANGFIVAGTLNTITQGNQVLTGPNQVASFTASSETGNVSLRNTAPVLTLGSMDLPGALLIDQTGTLSIPGTVSALSHTMKATGDVLVGSAGATNAALLYASGDISITTPGSVIVRGSDVTPLAASAVLGDGNLRVAAGNVTIQGGGALLTPAAMRGEAVDISAASELRVKGGSGHLSPALLSSGRNVNLTIGDAVRVDAGRGLLSFARIQTEIKDGVIHISFPDLSQGGYFVNGVEGRTHQGETGFFTLNKPAKLGKTLLVDYGGAD